MHLYLPNYPADKLEAEVHRIQEKRPQFQREVDRLKTQVCDIRQAMVDKEGLRRFCEIASRNLNSLDDSEWRVLLETIGLKVLVDGYNITIKVVLPTLNDENDIIAGST